LEWLIRSPLSGVKVKKRKRKEKKVISAQTWVGRQLAGPCRRVKKGGEWWGWGREGGEVGDLVGCRA
jgi:hypothetical protein